MKLARILVPNRGVVPAARLESGHLVVLDGIAGVDDDLVGTLDRLGAARLDELAHARAAQSDAVLIDERVAQFDVPVASPQKIVCVALNYAEHAAEGDQAAPEQPVIFFKPPSSLLPHRQTVRNPTVSNRLDYEIELGVVIGTRGSHVAAADWRSVVCGYTVFNDVTARDLQLVAIDRNQPWDHSKAFDTFAPCGPYLVTADEVPDPMDLALSLRVDDEVRQSSRTSFMIFDIPTLIEVISNGITLEPGDIIATGTPSGIGPVESGQVMVAEIEGVGELVNAVEYEREDAAEPAQVVG